MLQGVAGCCRVLQGVAECRGVCIAMCHSVLHTIHEMYYSYYLPNLCLGCRIYDSFYIGTLKSTLLIFWLFTMKYM